jgi:hypothetical protein
MARKAGSKPRIDRLGALLSSGDYAGARDAARGVLADPAASDGDREAAIRTLKRLRPDPGAVVTAVVCIAIALGVAAWKLMQG